MKVAVIFAGFLRSHVDLFSYFEKNLFSKYDCDIFYCAWDRIEGGGFQNNFGRHINQEEKAFLENTGRLKLVNIDTYTKNKDVFKILKRENDIFTIDERAKEHGEYFANRIIDQWYMIKEAFNMIQGTSQYDIIFRLRFDSPILNIDLKENSCLNVPNDISGWEFTDHMAYGNYDVMKTYCGLYDEIYNLYVKHNIDISHAVNMPKFYIEKNNIEIVKDVSLTYCIINHKGTFR